jgi:hypothetical protein
MIIPLNLAEVSHWSLAIIVNLDGGLTKEECLLNIEDGKPCIIYLDSMFKMQKHTLTALARCVRLSLSIIS